MDKLMRDLNSKSKLNKYECISFDSYPDKESTVWKDDQQRSEYTG